MLAFNRNFSGNSEPVFPRTVRGLGAAVFLIALMFAVAAAHAQDLEPRSYSNSPVGMNFLIAGYAYSDGDMAFDPALPVADAHYHMHTEVFGFARSFGAWGNSAKIDVIAPYSSFSGSAMVSDQLKYRAMSGFHDPLFRFSMNFYGAPALSLKEFSSYRQDLIIGASLQISAPVGQYDNTKLVNLGNNRWSFKPQLGISKAWGPWIVEVAPSITFYTDNNDFNQGGRFEQAPLYAVQTHIVHQFHSGIWLALDGTYYTGGRTTINGVESQNLQANTRVGVTMALPVDRYNSIKLHASTGGSTRTGTEFSALGIAWQYRWGAGF